MNRRPAPWHNRFQRSCPREEDATAADGWKIAFHQGTLVETPLTPPARHRCLSDTPRPA